MSNWYNTNTTDTWFSANEVGAWTPTLTATTPAPAKPSSNIKVMKQQPQQTAMKNWTESKQMNKKITENGITVPPQIGTVKFHELPSNSGTHQGAWDEYIVKDEAIQNSLLGPPQLAPEEFVGGWDTPTSSIEVDYQKPKRNSDIEAELNRQNLYKTELCLSWVETGTCRYGPKCQFAHGKQELRPVLRHPKYKTEICKTYNSTGQCPYGKRCRFVHQLYELRPPTNALEVELTVIPEDDEETAEIQRKLNELNISLLAPDPVFPALRNVSSEQEVPQESTPQKKGSRLPIFQYLRKQKW